MHRRVAFGAVPCEHDTNGMPCSSPAMRGERYCYVHMALHPPEPHVYLLPVLSDPDSIRTAIREMIRAVYNGHLKQKEGASIFYALQIAASTFNGRPPVDQPQLSTQEEKDDNHQPPSTEPQDVTVHLGEKANS